MNLYNDIVQKNEKIAVIGLGYVGLPIAIEFSKKANVIGYDLNQKKINTYMSGIDPTLEVGDLEISNSKIEFTNKEEDIQKAKFYIIAVPTPIKDDKTPDLSPVINASKTVGRNLSKNSIIVYESTVYPGVTENICIPILEQESGMKCGIDFKVGYSPERINPGDKKHKLKNIKKVVSGIDMDVTEEIAKIYEMVIEAGVYRASNIKVAEAAKVVENSQRDINIAFMNELALVFDKMSIDTLEVIEAMNTKWNALNFYPGLVGGHCIGIDPYYFIYEAEKLGYHSQIILSGRKVNDSMGEYVANVIIKKLVLAEKNVRKSKIAILGMTFKENCPDTRNSKVDDIIKVLNSFGIIPSVVDPYVNKEKNKNYNIINLNEVVNMDCIVFAVSHEEFKKLSRSKIISMFDANLPNSKKVIIDVKGIIEKKYFEKEGYLFWRL